MVGLNVVRANVDTKNNIAVCNVDFYCVIQLIVTAELNKWGKWLFFSIHGTASTFSYNTILYLDDHEYRGMASKANRSLWPMWMNNLII